MIKGIPTFEEMNANHLDPIDMNFLYSNIAYAGDVYREYKNNIIFRREVDRKRNQSKDFAEDFINIFGPLIEADKKRAFEESSGKGLGK